MAPTNDFLPFCPTDTGTNLLSEADYLAATDRTSGNKPGVASAKLNNKAIRQSTFIASQLAQFISNQTVTDVLDDANTAKLLAQITGAITAYPPTLTRMLSSTGNFNLTFIFIIASGSATAGATYTNNGVTYTVVSTISSGTTIKATGGGAPAVSGTLTKTGGTGDATLTFYTYRQPLYLRVRGVGAGGGAGGSGTAAGAAGTTGGNTTFGTALLVGNGGVGGSAGAGTHVAGGAGGTASLGTGPVGAAITGGSGNGNSQTGANTTGFGGVPGVATPFGGGGGGTDYNGSTGTNQPDNTGAGGAGSNANVTNVTSGSGGGAGGQFDAWIFGPFATYVWPWVVGAKGTGGAPGTNGFAGYDGGSGVIEVVQFYQ